MKRAWFAAAACCLALATAWAGDATGEMAGNFFNDPFGQVTSAIAE